MTEAFLGEIRMTMHGFAPKYWATCDGSQLQVTTNPALFALLGGTYGGDWRTVFNLPNLSGVAPVSMGQSVQLGQSTGPLFEEAAGDGYATGTDLGATEYPPYQGVHFIICTLGIFPPHG